MRVLQRCSQPSAAPATKLSPSGASATQHLASAIGVPELGINVIRHGEHSPSVRAEAGADDAPVMERWQDPRIAGQRGPAAGGLIVCTRHQPTTVWAESRHIDGAVVVESGADGFERWNPKNLHRRAGA